VYSGELKQPKLGDTRMSMTKYAVIPKGTDMSNIDYLTIGKKYLIKNCNKIKRYDGLYFEMVADNGLILYCLEFGCPNLSSQNWEIQESRRHDDKELLSLKAVSVLTFVFIVAMCSFAL
jgi:hypothetical protein